MRHEPLLEPGIHDLALIQLHSLCVEPFPGSVRRPMIHQLFSQVLETLRRFNIRWEIWVNGSYLTTKPEPNDIDVLVTPLDMNEVSALSMEEKDDLRRLFDRSETKRRLLTDLIFVSASDWEDPNYRMYWRGVFGFDRDDRPKGWVRLVVETAHG